MGEEFVYDTEDGKIIISRDSYDRISLWDSGGRIEVSFNDYHLDQAIEVLNNIYRKLIDNPTWDYINCEASEYWNEEDEPTGEYYWDDDTMNDEDINPYFEPEGDFYGTNISRERVPYIIEALEEYNNPTITDESLPKFSLNRLLKLYKDNKNE